MTADLLFVVRRLSKLLVLPVAVLLVASGPAQGRHPEAARIEQRAVDLAAQGQRAEADKHFRKALRLDLKFLGSEHPGVADDYSDFANNLLAEGKVSEAERMAAKAVAIARRQRAATLQTREGPDGALLRARAHLNQADPLRFIFERYLNAAWAQASAGHESDEHLRSKAFMAIQDLAGSASAQAMAMAAARSSAKGDALAGILREQQRLSNDVLKLDRQLMTTNADITTGSDAALRKRLHADMVSLAASNRKLDRAYPEYRALISPLPLSIAHARASLQADEGLLLLVASEGDVHSFAIGPHGSAWSRVAGGATTVASQLAGLQCQVDPETCKEDSAHGPTALPVLDGHLRYDFTAAHALYAALVAPVERPLAQARKVYVVTSGFLGDLPLAMLTTASPAPNLDDADPAVQAAAPWLANRYAFIHLPAVAGLRVKLVRIPVSRLDILDAYGDPLLGPATAPIVRGLKAFRGGTPGEAQLADGELLRTLPSLPGTRRELTAMAASAGVSSSIHLQGQATEYEVKHDPRLATAGLVVFATHGLLAGEIGEGTEAGLILTPPEIASAEDDGILTASEASQLTLSADWVILSACNTAATASIAGHASADSLSRGFLYAGAHAVLASHWRVSDEATAALTVEALTVHKTHPELTGAQALQAAMRAVRTGRRSDGSELPDWHSDWAHPSAWAPFSYTADHDD